MKCSYCGGGHLNFDCPTEDEKFIEEVNELDIADQGKLNKTLRLVLDKQCEQLKTLREIVELLKKSNAFYADKKSWGFNEYPKKQKHLAWMIESHDCGWCSENEKFVGGKLARSTQKQVSELEKKLEER